ncbi:hypothetical protein Ddc_21947 [Ditylenchus destructor]|nr:hypothetical protein Ddc_21947 [Ditylenchus destructor]
MSCSKPLPPFVCDSLYYLNRDQLDRFTIVCRPLKNFIERYLHSKPYRAFDQLWIRRGLYRLCHNGVQWHPNRDDYNVQTFLAGQKCSIDESKRPWNDHTYYSLAEMRPYLGPTIRIMTTFIDVDGHTYNSEHIAEMESIAYLWRDYEIEICNDDESRIVAEQFQPILDSPTILQCRLLKIDNAHFSFKDYKVLYSVKIIEMFYVGDDYIEPNYWADFLEQPGVKPIVSFDNNNNRANIDNLIDRLKEAFSSAVSPNSFKIVFAQSSIYKQPLTEFRETNKTTSEKLELKKGLPAEYQEDWLQDFDNYTLERSSI